MEGRGVNSRAREKARLLPKYSGELSLRLRLQQTLGIVSPPTCQSSTPASLLQSTHPGRFHFARGEWPSLRPAPPQALALLPAASRPPRGPAPGPQGSAPGAGPRAQGALPSGSRPSKPGARSPSRWPSRAGVGELRTLRPPSAAPPARPGRRRAVRPAPQGAGTSPSRAGALGPRRPAGQRLRNPAASRPQPRRHHAQPPPLPQLDAPRSAGRRTARRLLSLRHRGTLTSEAPPAATAAGAAAVASAAAAPSAAARTGASPRGHSPPAAAAATTLLPSPVSGLGSGTTPGSPRRHFDSDREQEGLASARPWRACAALRSRTAPPAPAVGAPLSRDPTSVRRVGGGGARWGGAFLGSQAKRRVRAHSSGNVCPREGPRGAGYLLQHPAQLLES